MHLQATAQAHLGFMSHTPGAPCLSRDVGIHENMHALEVLVNGKRVCIASPGESGLVISNVVLTGAISGSPGASAARFRVGGVLDEQHLEWANRPLVIGDVVEVRLVDAPCCDPPASVEPVSDAQRERLRAASDSADN